jgi:outer membrane protein assembly factor BamB
VNSIRYLIPLGLSVILLAGCGIFGDKDEELPPAELLKFKQTLDLKKVWSAKVGGGSELLRLELAPAGDGSRVYTASQDGVVSAFDPEKGKRLWRSELKINLSAGPGVGENMVVVTGENGEVIAFGAADGGERWRTDVGGESLARPLVTDEGVVIYTIDGRLRVLSLFDGTERWSMEQDLPALTLRGLSSPIIVGNTIIVGFDSGKLMALDLITGDTEWESMISPPSGRSDLERLSDIDGQ